MKNLEYTKMASVYDKFYKNKNYKKEVEFIESFIKSKNCRVLDAGAGTGNHAKILYDLGYNVVGFDKSQDMVNIANSKINNSFFQSDLLTFETNEKFDVIISFFAVFNHLKSYKEFKIALKNLKSALKDNGTIIIDLHNPQKSGEKQETVGNITRIMKWRRCVLLNKEFSKLTYIVDGKKYITNHIFKIYKIGKIEKMAKEIGFKSVKFYANYDVTKKAVVSSKNIQMVISL